MAVACHFIRWCTVVCFRLFNYFDLSYVKLIIYGALIAIGYPILLVPYLSLTFDVIGQSNHAKEWRIEYIVMRELFLNGGRATSVLLFLLAITLFDAKEAIPALMLIVGAGHFIIYFLCDVFDFRCRNLRAFLLQ